MATARDLLNISLRYVGQKTDYSEAADEDYSVAITKLNQYIELLRQQGLQLNSSQVEITNLSQPVNYPTWAHNAIELNVGLMLWTVFNIDKPVPQLLYANAKKAEDEMFVIAGREINPIFPSTLPKGMGNRDGFFGYYDRFYPDCDDNIYPCDTGNLQTETSVNIKTEGAE